MNESLTFKMILGIIVTIGVTVFSGNIYIDYFTQT